MSIFNFGFIFLPVVWNSRGKNIRKRVGSAVNHGQAYQQIVRELKSAELTDLVQHQIKVHDTVNELKIFIIEIVNCLRKKTFLCHKS